MKKMSPLFILGVVLLVLLAVYTGLLFVQKATVNRQLSSAEKAILSEEAELTEFQEKNIEQAIAAKKTVDSLLRERIKWSTIIQRILDTVPQSGKREDLVEILSYSGSTDNKISMNVKTVPLRREPYFDVATLIETFDESDYFEDNFVASISSGVTPLGEEILSFVLSTSYVEEGAFEEYVEAVEEDEADGEGVSR